MTLPTRAAACVVAGGILATLAAVPSAAAAPRPVRLSVSIGDGTLLLILKTKPRLTKAKAVASRPCLAYDYGSDRVKVCVRNEKWAKVVRTGDGARAPYLIPYRLQRAAGRRLVVVMRHADVGLPAGKATATAWCAENCPRSSRRVKVFPLRLRSCTADAPWLVHRAPRPVGKAVALTFDDGPDVMTRDVLRILADKGVAATFFQVGTMIVQRPQLLPRIMARGHAIGNHTWSHPLMHAGAAAQLTDVQRIVRKLTGFRPCVWRAPYGENPPPVVDLAASLRLTTVHWNVDPGDWRGASADAIVATAVRQSRPGSISVFHDGGDHRQVLAALPRYIDEMHRRGYRFLSVPELLGLPLSYLERQ